MSEFQLVTPVAFIIFNRPDTTERVFAEIARARPPKLLVVGDGPRPGRTGEVEKVAACRAIIELVDWPCEVLTNYSETNLGCKLRVSSGLDWVFEQVEEAIILEDDCLPHPTFFRFCESLLEYYREDSRIGFICGTNLSNGKNNKEESYYFSKYPHIWGWASWRRVWVEYDVEMRELEALKINEGFSHLFDHKSERAYWLNIFNAVKNGSVDTWDAQVVFLAFTRALLSIYPTKNLISNIGFGMDATHTKNLSSNLSNLKAMGTSSTLRHPIFMFQDARSEKNRKRVEGIGIGYFQKAVAFAWRKIKSKFLKRDVNE